MIMSLDINQGYISNCQKLYCRSRYEVEKDDRVVSIVTSQSEGTPGVSKSTVWAYTQPGNVLYCWDPHREVVLNRIDMREYTVDPSKLFKNGQHFTIFARFCSALVFRIFVLLRGFFLFSSNEHISCNTVWSTT